MKLLDRDLVKNNILNEQDAMRRRLDILERLLYGGAPSLPPPPPPGGGGGVLEGPGIDLIGNRVGLGGDTVLVYKSDGSPVIEFPSDLYGIGQALAAATSGDVVFLDKVGTITGDITVGPGIELRSRSRKENTLVGKITLDQDASINNLTVANVANSAAELYGVIGPVAGTAYILFCNVSATQSGAGNAYAIGATRGASLNNGNIKVQYSYLNGISVGGDGYAARSTRGIIEIWHGRAYGSTARYIKV